MQEGRKRKKGGGGGGRGGGGGGGEGGVGGVLLPIFSLPSQQRILCRDRVFPASVATVGFVSRQV